MKNFFILLLFVIACNFVGHSQVGINTVTPRGELEISSRLEGGGFLTPQYALVGNNDTNTVRNPQGGNLVIGTIVYNTNTSTGGNSLDEGYVFWDGNRWMPFGGDPSGEVGWRLDGNTITNVNFIGSTNPEALRFRVNNSPVGELHPQGAISFGFGADANVSNGIAIGRDSRALQDATVMGREAFGNNRAVSIGVETEATQQDAIAIGYRSNSDGNKSVAIGSEVLASMQNTVAIGNLSEAIGVNSISIGSEAVSSGANATVVGNEAEATGLNSLAIGANSIASNENSSAIGSRARATGNNAMAIGFQSIATERASIILGNTLTESNPDSARIGIGTTDPDAKLHVEGSLKIVDGNESDGKVLTSDGDGNATWQTLAPGGGFNPEFGQIFTQNDVNGVTANTIVPFGTTGISSSNISLATNFVQTGSITGVYELTYTILSRRNGNTNASVTLFLNQGTGTNKVPQSDITVVGNGNNIRYTATKSILVNVTSPNQRFSIFSSDNSNNIQILRESILSIKLVAPAN